MQQKQNELDAMATPVKKIHDKMTKQDSMRPLKLSEKLQRLKEKEALPLNVSPTTTQVCTITTITLYVYIKYAYIRYNHMFIVYIAYIDQHMKLSISVCCLQIAIIY